ncbi:MAG: DMT family transporter [Methylobacter sp.]
MTDTKTLKVSDDFSRLKPSLRVVAGYGVAFCFLLLTFRSVPVGVACAIWPYLGVMPIASIESGMYHLPSILLIIAVSLIFQGSSTLVAKFRRYRWLLL